MLSLYLANHYNINDDDDRSLRDIEIWASATFARTSCDDYKIVGKKWQFFALKSGWHTTYNQNKKNWTIIYLLYFSIHLFSVRVCAREALNVLTILASHSICVSLLWLEFIHISIVFDVISVLSCLRDFFSPLFVFRAVSFQFQFSLTHFAKMLLWKCGDCCSRKRKAKKECFVTAKTSQHKTAARTKKLDLSPEQCMLHVSACVYKWKITCGQREPRTSSDSVFFSRSLAHINNKQQQQEHKTKQRTQKNARERNLAQIKVPTGREKIAWSNAKSSLGRQQRDR